MAKIHVREIKGVPYFVTSDAPADHVPIHPDQWNKIVTDNSSNEIRDIFTKEIEVADR